MTRTLQEATKIEKTKSRWGVNPKEAAGMVLLKNKNGFVLHIKHYVTRSERNEIINEWRHQYGKTIGHTKIVHIQPILKPDIKKMKP